MEQKIRLGIIGIGNMGSAHASHVAEGCCPDLVLAAVADLKPGRLQWARETLGDRIACFSSAEEMLDSGLIDACIVSVPHYDHAEYAMECMKRGIHVMVEKPAGVYTLQVREMNTEAEKHPQVVFGMMFNQRTNGVYQKMRELVQSGKYGQIRRVNWIITTWYRPQAYYNSGEWRATWAGEGGGVLLNQCPHQLDLLQWICGMPVKVSAHMHWGLWHDIEVEDDVTAYLEYPNGATGVFVTSTGDACGSNRFEIQMDGAKLLVENDRLTVWEFEMPEPEFSRTNTVPFGSPKTKTETFVFPEEGSQHVQVMNAWAGAILRGEPLTAQGLEGINGLMLSNAMHLSAFLNQPVDLPFDEALYQEELMKRVATSRRKTNVTEIVSDVENTYQGANNG